jgi:NAD(P)-dependent dehydrogenase (short-subunit alcohol dehydrogenase family)
MSPKAQWYLKESGTYQKELDLVALGRFGEPEDIAPTAIFLASDDSNYVSGQTVGVDGGSTML